MNAASEWNDPADIALVSQAFDAWAAAVIAKDRPLVESFHDDGFRLRMGDPLIDKAGHVLIELSVAVREMSIIEITSTRRIGDILLVWSKHLIRADAVSPVPELGLVGDWGDEKAAREGFVQTEFTAWRQEGAGLKCLVFEAKS